MFQCCGVAIIDSGKVHRSVGERPIMETEVSGRLSHGQPRQANEEFGIKFHDHSRRAKRRAMGINNAKNNSQRAPLYRDLIKVTDKVIKQADAVAEQLEHVEIASIMQAAVLQTLASSLREYAALARKVISRTRTGFADRAAPGSGRLTQPLGPLTIVMLQQRRAPAS
jgi:hypothetical protein